MTVNVLDIARNLGRTLSSLEEAQAATWIADARLIIGARLGDLALLDQARVDYVVREAVLARFRNPEGFQSETIDDYTYRLPTETRRITILDEWWDLLAPAANANVFSARPTFTPDTVDLSLDWS